MIDLLFSLFAGVHNFSYKVLSVLAIKKNNGLHPKHRILNYHQFFLDHLSSDDLILDVGCGNGSLASDLAKKVRQVFAIDIEAANISTAKKKFPAGNITYIVGDATTYPFTEHFDAIILSNVLEHLENRVKFLKEISRLAPKILIRVPLITRDWLAVYKKEQGAEYRLDLTHFTEYSEDSFREEMEAAGLRINELSVRFGELYAVTEVLRA